jgi:hypothetical protein
VPVAAPLPTQSKAPLILAGMALAISCGAFIYTFLKSPPSLVPGSFHNPTVLVDARGHIVSVTQGMPPTTIIQGVLPGVSQASPPAGLAGETAKKPFPWSPPAPVEPSPSPERTTKLPDKEVPHGPESEPARIVENYVKFQSVRFKTGKIHTGWQYADSNATEPEAQWCYYTIRNVQSKGLEPTLDLKDEVDPGAIRAAGLTYDEYVEAQSKCQWFGNIKPALRPASGKAY